MKDIPLSERLTISIAEFAKLLGVSEPLAAEITHQAGFPIITQGRRRLIIRHELENWLSKQVAGENNAEA